MIRKRSGEWGKRGVLREQPSSRALKFPVEGGPWTVLFQKVVSAKLALLNMTNVFDPVFVNMYLTSLSLYITALVDRYPFTICTDTT